MSEKGLAAAPRVVHVSAASADYDVTVGAGVFAYMLRRCGFPMPPIVIGLVLGQQFEMSIGQMILYKGDMPWLDYILNSPIATCLLIVTAFIVCVPMIRRLLAARTGAAVRQGQQDS